MHVIRQARAEDLPALLEMQAASLLALGAAHYPRPVLDAALSRLGTMDARLVTDGTYLVLEVTGRLAGSAGWSLHAPNYAALMTEPLRSLPGRTGLVRSVYVSPDFARRGLGRRLMQAVESRLVALRVQTSELMATLSGAPLYATLGYRELSTHALRVAPGVDFEVRRMARCLDQRAAQAA
ncbi:GNAT family N-acetyltransferase [Falsiroseomonas sp. E2-1-a20]|uniref:GNAT family N-acetyltransferase n=1 Tax=Falsiroseomonas sp. E2-1-a20 TaxID=3239300 RepID=UPI003F2A8F5D